MAKGMRRQGRELALKLIYSLQDQDSSLEEVFADFWANFRFRDDVLGDPHDEFNRPIPPEVREYVEGLVREYVEEIGRASCRVTF